MIGGQRHELEAVEMLAPLGGGGMAEVFLGRARGDTGFEKLVAVKQLRPHMAMNTNFINMLVDEARVAANLTHSNIGQIYDLRREGDSYYIIMEFIHGASLHHVIHALTCAEVLASTPMVAYIMSGLCAGLAYAHDRRDPLGRPLQIIHRDVSPDNVMVSYEGEVKLIDFGIVKAVPRLHETLGAKIKGKPIYMSPEQASGGELDHRTDIYSAGLVLYEMLCHSNPLAWSEAIYEQIAFAAEPRIPPPSTLEPSTDPELERICMTALAVNPDDRFSSADVMEQELATCLHRHPYHRQELASWMKETFAVERETLRQAISSAHEGIVNRPPQRTANVTPPVGYADALKVIHTQSALGKAAPAEDAATTVVDLQRRPHDTNGSPGSMPVDAAATVPAPMVFADADPDPEHDDLEPTSPAPIAPPQVDHQARTVLKPPEASPEPLSPVDHQARTVADRPVAPTKARRKKHRMALVVLLSGATLVVALALALFLRIQRPEPLETREPAEPSSTTLAQAPDAGAPGASAADLRPPQDPSTPAETVDNRVVLQKRLADPGSSAANTKAKKRRRARKRRAGKKRSAKRPSRASNARKPSAKKNTKTKRKNTKTKEGLPFSDI